MKRNPTIHVTLTNLIKILRHLGFDDPMETAVSIMTAAVPYAVKDRYVVKGDNSTRRKLKKHIDAVQKSRVSIEKFNQLLLSCRMAAGHKGVRVIRDGDAQYMTLKEVAGAACEFADAFKFDQVEEGVKVFIQLGLKLMRRDYSINKFKYYQEKIYAHYEAKHTIDDDPEPDTTKEVYRCWKDLMLEYAGLDRQLERDEDYVVMVYVRMDAESAGAHYEDWLRAQFEGLKFLDRVPNLSQLYGDKAYTRYLDYQANHPKKLKAANRKQTLTGDDAREDFEKRYSEVRKKHTEQ